MHVSDPCAKSFVTNIKLRLSIIHLSGFILLSGVLLLAIWVSRLSHYAAVLIPLLLIYLIQYSRMYFSARRVQTLDFTREQVVYSQVRRYWVFIVFKNKQRVMIFPDSLERDF
jgi:hypothetical protein